MTQLFLTILPLVGAALLLLCIRVLLGKKFIHTHVDGNKALQEKGIHCAQAQDALMRHNPPTAVAERTPDLSRP